MTRKIVLAVSGGLDSMVLLDVMCKCLTAEGLMVAHFNHGMRTAADEDEQLVREAAGRANVKFIVGRASLGERVSEETARRARYDFLLQTARTAGAELWTAQHFDDVVETVAINLIRGTGWRGLAAMGRTEVRRPLIDCELLPSAAREMLEEVGIVTRRTLVRYAAREGVIFREDASNHDDSYLRGRVRERLITMREERKLRLAKLFYDQKRLRAEIELALDKLVDKKTLAGRDWAELDEDVAVELIRELGRKNQLRLVQAEAEKLLVALKELPRGKKVNLSGGRLIEMQKNGFYLTN